MPSPLLYLGVGLMLTYFLYRWFLPRPIPGIPYNIAAAKSVLGDMPAIIKHVKETQEIFAWFNSQVLKHQYPLVQIFMSPTSKPILLLADYRESQDILLRRTKEFDRSSIFGDWMEPLLPDHHVYMKTNAEYKRHRRLIQDLMMPTFLHNIAAPRLYATTLDLIGLWGEKARLADGHAFAASEDAKGAGMDAVWAFALGMDSVLGTSKVNLDLLASLDTIGATNGKNEPVVFPRAKNNEDYEAVLALIEKLDASVRSPMPRAIHWFLKWKPRFRKAEARKEKLISEEIEKARSRLAGAEIMPTCCAADHIVNRERQMAEKEGRAPKYHTRAMYDELFGFITAGYDTTSATFAWGLKLLSDNANEQNKLRSILRAAFFVAAKEERQPTVQEIIKTQIPYLDAMQEEMIRLSLATTTIVRSSVVDTTILGHHVPKGIDVYMITNGPGFLSPAFTIDEELRSESSQKAKSRVRHWNHENSRDFMPERWIVTTENGDEEYDSTAGPQLILGLGPRGCYGRRLAYLNLRILIVLVVLNFELLHAEDDLSGYAAIDRVVREPQQCYIRLRKAT